MTERVWRRPSNPTGLALPGWGFDGAVFDLAPWSGGLSTPLGTCFPIGWKPPLRAMDVYSRARSPQEGAFGLRESAALGADWLAEWSQTVYGSPQPPFPQVLFGWSMGAWIALQAVIARPEWWSRVVLAAAPVRFPQEAITEQRRSLAADPSAHLSAFRHRSLVYERPAREWIRTVGRSPSYVNDRVELDAGLEFLGSLELRSADLAAASRAMQSSGGSLECWHGARDVVAPIADLRAELDRLASERSTGGGPAMTLRVAEGSGHGCFLAEEAADWWDRPPKSGGPAPSAEPRPAGLAARKGLRR